MTTKKSVFLLSDANHHALKDEKGQTPSLSHFIQHIENKPLLLLWESKESAGVRDADDKEWTVWKTSLQKDAGKYQAEKRIS